MKQMQVKNGDCAATHKWLGRILAQRIKNWYNNL